MNEQTIKWKDCLEEMRIDTARKQKKGISFIAASIFVWTAIFCVQNLDLPLIEKNIYTFWCTAIMFPFACLLAKILQIDLREKNNPINKAGFLFTCNQIIYLIIPMWMCSAEGDKMLMVFTIIFGAHLLPYGWLYKSRTYFVMSIIIPGAAVIVGCNFHNAMLAAMMICIQILFTVCLAVENHLLKK